MTLEARLFRQIWNVTTSLMEELEFSMALSFSSRTFRHGAIASQCDVMILMGWNERAASSTLDLRRLEAIKEYSCTIVFSSHPASVIILFLYFTLA